MQHIQKLSHLLLWISTFAIIAWPILAIHQWLFGTFDDVTTPEGVIHLGEESMTLGAKVICIFSDIVRASPFYIGLFIVRSLAKSYVRKDIFTLYNARRYKKLGWLFFLYGLLAEPISHMLSVLGATFSLPQGHRWLTLEIGTPSIEAIFGGLLVILMSWVMAEGYRLHEEQQLTV